MATRAEKLGKELVEEGLIKEIDYHKAIKEGAETGKELLLFLIRTGKINEDQIHSFYTRRLAFPYVKLANLDLDPIIADHIPRDTAKKYGVLPIDKVGNRLTVAMVDPLDEGVRKLLAQQTELKIDPLLCSILEIDKAIVDAYGEEGGREGTEGRVAIEEGRVFRAGRGKPQVFFERQPKAFTIQGRKIETIGVIGDTLINWLMEKGATELHLNPTFQETEVLLRIDGVLVEGKEVEIPRHLHPHIVGRFKSLADLDRTQTEIVQEGYFWVQKEVARERSYFSVWITPTPLGEKIIVRRVDKPFIPLEETGASPKFLRALGNVLTRGEGFLVLFGPKESGKTTFLSAILESLYHPGIEVWEVSEDMEIELEGIIQLETKGRKIKFAQIKTFLEKIRPEILGMDEADSEEKIESLLTLSGGGTLCLGILPVGREEETFSGLLSLTSKRELLSSCLRGIIGCLLLRKICPHCKIPYIPTPEERERWKIEENVSLFESKGCERCGGRGYQGRCGVYSFLPLESKEVEKVMEERGLVDPSFLENLREQKRGVSLLEEVRLKLSQGLTDLKEVGRVLRGFTP